MLVLFLPDSIGIKFGILALRAKYLPWIGGGTLAAFVLWVVQLVPWINAKFAQRRYRTQVLQNLFGLTEQEQFLLCYCTHRGQRTVYLAPNDSAAQALCNKGLLVPSSGLGRALSWPFTIPQFVWEHIRANRHVLMSDADWNSPALLRAFDIFEQGIERNPGWF